MGVFPAALHLVFGDKFSLSPELLSSASLHLPALGPQHIPPYLAFYMGAEDPNTGPCNGVISHFVIILHVDGSSAPFVMDMSTISQLCF